MDKSATKSNRGNADLTGIRDWAEKVTFKELVGELFILDRYIEKVEPDNASLKAIAEVLRAESVARQTCERPNNGDRTTVDPLTPAHLVTQAQIEVSVKEVEELIKTMGERILGLEAKVVQLADTLYNRNAEIERWRNHANDLDAKIAQSNEQTRQAQELLAKCAYKLEESVSCCNPDTKGARELVDLILMPKGGEHDG